MFNSDERRRTLEKTVLDLKEISPLALPECLASYECRDKDDAFAVLEEAESKFRDKGGVARGLFDASWKATVNAVSLCLLRRVDEATYRKLIRSKTTDFAQYAEKAFTFELADYGMQAAETDPQTGYARDELKQDILRRGMVRHPTAAEKGASGAQFDVNEYRRSEDFDVSGGASRFVKDQANDDGSVRGVGGETLQSRKESTNGDRAQMAEGDHVTPLKMVHETYGHFIERYVNLDAVDENGKTALQQLANDPSNLQILSGDKNASKGGGTTNADYILLCDKVAKAAELYKQMESASPAEKAALQQELKNLGLNNSRRRDARLMAKEDELSEEDKKKLRKYKLTEAQKKELLENQRKSERAILKRMAQEGGKTVLIEQVGRLVGHLVGPVGFEIRDSLAHGVAHGFGEVNAFEAVCRRIWRALKYVFGKINEILVDFTCDVGKMLATLFAGFCKAVKRFLGKFFDLALSGISVVVESVKILMGKGSLTEKGDAILKVVVGFATGILGQTLIDSLLEATGVPDPFSDILAAIASSVVGAAVTGVFNKLDLFGIQREMRMQRIEEIFRLRKQRLDEARRTFNMAALETMRQHRCAFESIRAQINAAISGRDFDVLNASLDDACSLYRISLPYTTPAEFLAYVRAGSVISIQ